MIKSFSYKYSVNFSHHYSTCLIDEKKKIVVAPFFTQIWVYNIEQDYERFYDVKDFIYIEDIDVIVKARYISNSGKTSEFLVFSENCYTKKPLYRTDMSLSNRIVWSYDIPEYIVVYDYNRRKINLAYRQEKPFEGYDENLSKVNVWQYVNYQRQNKPIYLSTSTISLIKLSKNIFFNKKDNKFLFVNENEEPNPHWFDSWDY